MQKRHRIHSWIVFPLALVLLSGFWVIFAKKGMDENRLEGTKQTIRLAMHDQTTAFRTVLEWQFSVLSVFSEKTGEEADFSAEDVRASLSVFAGSVPFESVAIAGTDLTGYDDRGNTFDLSERRYARSCLQGEQAVEYLPESFIDKEPHFVAAVPIFKDSQAVGLVVGIFERDVFYQSLDTAGYAGGYCLVCDQEGSVLAFSDNLPIGLTEWNLFEAAEEEDGVDAGGQEQRMLEDFRSGADGSFFFSYDGKGWYAFYTPLGVNGWYLVSALPSEAVAHSIDPVTRRLVIALLAFLLAVVFFTAYSGFHSSADLWRLETEQSAELGRLEEAAKVDAVTGLRRNATGCEEIADRLSKPVASASNVLFLVELSDLHVVFEEVGYEAGNQFLADAAAVLKKLFQPTDILCYRGSSQFLAFVGGLQHPELLVMQATELCAELQMIRVYDNRSYSIGGFIGISVSGADAPKSFEEILGEAASALNSIRNKKQGFAIYQPPESGNEAAYSELRQFSTAYSFSVRVGKILEEMSSGLILMDAGEKLRPLYVSPSYYRQLGALSEARMGAEDWEHIDDGNDLPLFLAAVRKCASTQEPQDVVYRVMEDVWRHASIVPFRDESIGRAMALIMVTDVSHMQKEVLEGKVSQKKAELLLDMSRLISFEVDVAAHSVSISPGFMEKYGWDDADNENVPESNIEAGLVHEESVAPFRAMYASIFKGDAEGQSDVTLLNRVDGRFHELRISWKMIYDEHSLPVQAVGVAEELFELVGSSELSNLSELQRKLYVEERYFERAQQYQRALRRYRHDRKNNIVALRGLLDSGDLEGAKKYLKNMADVINADAQLIITGNPAVDALLSDKLAKANSLGIKVEHMVGIAPGCSIDAMDFCLALGCCLDNAIEACQRSEGMTEKPFILLKLIEKRGVIVFKMLNTSAVPPVKEKSGSLYSTGKQDSQNHGFGLHNLEEVVEKYSGNLELHQTQEGTFQTSFTLFTGA